jgi:hypothetical protein
MPRQRALDDYRSGAQHRIGKLSAPDEFDGAGRIGLGQCVEKQLSRGVLIELDPGSLGHGLMKATKHGWS